MNQNTNVNVVPSYGQRGDLHFSQYDVGRTATINLYAVNEAYTIPVGATVKIQATKPSGLGFDVACSFSGSVVTVVSTETMTEESGRFPCELKIIDGDDVIGTANFIFCVEKSPHPDGTVDGDSEEIINEIEALVLQSEGWAVGTQNGVPVSSDSPYYENNSKWWSEHPAGGGITQAVKVALLNCFENVAWINENGQTYYDALYDALYDVPAPTLTSISAVYTQSGTVYDTDTLDSLKSDLVVTATYSDSSTATVPSADYTLSGTLAIGTSVVTVTYEGMTTTFNVDVSWRFVLNNALVGNATNDASGGVATRIYTTSAANRGGLNPVAQFIPAGSYSATIPNGINVGFALIRIDESSPSVRNIDYTWTGGAKDFWTGTATRDLSSGWQSGTYTFNVDYDAMLQINFKNTSSSNLSESDLTSVKNGLMVTRTS